MLRNSNSCSAVKVVSKKNLSGSENEQKKEKKEKKKKKDDKDATPGTKTKQPIATVGVQVTTPLKQSNEKAVKFGVVGSTPSPSQSSSVASPLSPKGTNNKKHHQLTKGVQQGIARLKEDSNDKKQSSGSSPIKSPFSYASVSPSKSPSLPSPSSASPSGKKSPYRPNQNKYKGISAGTSVEVYPNHIEIHLAKKGMKSKDLKEFLAWMENNPDCRRSPEGQIITHIKHFNLFDNNIGDKGIIALMNFLEKHVNDIQVSNLRLWNNQVGDAGVRAIGSYISKSETYPLKELHLSHNKISTPGALDLFKALKSCTKYPYSLLPTSAPVIPLWLRMEHNYISTPECLAVLDEKDYCIVESKFSKCTSRSCKFRAKFHLVFFEFQYYHPALALAKKSLAELSATSSQPLGDNPSPETFLYKYEDRAPFFMFLDTNVVVMMINEPSHPFSFDSIDSRYHNNTFGYNPNGANDSSSLGDRVFLVITDTVLQELDGLSKRGIIRSRDVERILLRGDKAGYIVMPGAFQGERLVEWLGQNITSSQVTNANAKNDRMIIDIALVWSGEVGETGYVCFISEDANARLIAKNQNLHTVSASTLNKHLTVQPASTVWTGKFLRSCVEELLGIKEENRGQTTTVTNPLAAFKSFAKDLQLAEELVRGLKVASESESDKEKLLKLLGQMLSSSSSFSPLPPKITQQPNVPSSTPSRLTTTTTTTTSSVSYNSAIFYGALAPLLVSEPSALPTTVSQNSSIEQETNPVLQNVKTIETKPLRMTSSNFNSAHYYQLLSPTLI